MSDTTQPEPDDRTRQIAHDLEGVRPFRADAIEGIKLLRQLGSGASSTVYLGREERHDRHVAVKVMSAYYCRSSEALARWQREATTLENLTHTNIVKGIRHGVADGRPYFVMEYVQGETLASRLRRLGHLADAEVRSIARSVLEALLAAHRAGIIHRDIKPSNIVISSDGHLKLMDFGLAKEEDDRSLTVFGAILGTPMYISPEQARGDLGIDIRSDIYSLGVTLFHLASGDLPYADLNTSLLLTRKITDDLPDVRTFKSDVTGGTAYLIASFCQRERTARPTTPRDALELLEQVERGEVPTSELEARTAERREEERARVSRSALPINSPLLATVISDRTLDTEPCDLAPNEVLFYEDDTSREAYILLSGEVEVLKAGRQLAVIAQPGAWLGEMSTLLESPRTATVRARVDCLLLRVKEKDFRQFMTRHPEMCFELARRLAERLETSNVRVRDFERRLAVARRHYTLMRKELFDDNEGSKTM